MSTTTPLLDMLLFFTPNPLLSRLQSFKLKLSRSLAILSELASAENRQMRQNRFLSHYLFGRGGARRMEIRIRYQRRDEATPRVLELTPEDYFDPLNPGETLSVWSVPRLLDTYQYTPHRADELLWTVVEVTDGESFWRERTQLLDGMRSLMHHTQQADGSEEIIHATELGPLCWHTIRTLKQAGQTWAVVMNSLTVERPVSLAESRNYCPSLSSEELKAFGRVQ